MLPVGFEPTISAGERPQTYALDRAATGTGTVLHVQSCYFRTSRKCFAIITDNLTSIKKLT